MIDPVALRNAGLISDTLPLMLDAQQLASFLVLATEIKRLIVLLATQL